MTFHSVFTTAATPAITTPLPDDVWEVYRTIRDASETLGIKPKIIQTLAAMVSCLKPGKGLVCFASNRELQRRLSGISEKTIRRHVLELQAAGILRRQDSPNRKRYVSRDASTGEVEAYGLDLTPMIESAAIWRRALEQQELEAGRKRHLRTKLLARLSWVDARGQGGIDTDGIRKALRRRHTAATLEKLIESVAKVLGAGALVEHTSEHVQPETVQPGTVQNEQAQPGEMTAAAGQNVRHPSMSETEDHDLEEAPCPASGSPSADRDMLRKMKGACSEAFQFCQGEMRSWTDIEGHARLLAPMIGIDRQLLEAAHVRHGSRLASLAVFLMVQMHPRIRNMQAYFRSLVSGKRANSFDPLALLDRMARTECGA